MSNRQCSRVLSAIARQPWAITPDGLDLILGIAQRKISDKEAVLATPMERREGSRIETRDGVARITVMGPIFPRADVFTEISGAVSIECLALNFNEALNDSSVKGIVLHFDSPGGQITGVNEFANQIYAARKVKPVVSYVSGYCASAAYWFATAASEIVAAETAYVGSIGVISAWTDDTAAKESEGLKDYEVVSSQSPNKRLDPTKGEGRAAIQRQVDELADIFISTVARNRAKSVARVQEKFGRGGVLLAGEAVKVGMIDSIGSLEGVMSAISGDNAGIKTGGIFSMNDKSFFRKFFGAAASALDKDDEDKESKKAAEDEDEEEEEEKARARKAKAAKARKKAAEDEEDEEAEEEEEEKEGKRAKAKKKASNDEDDEEEEKETRKAKAALMARNPRLYQLIRNEGVAKERARIKALDDMAFSAGKTLLNAAKYTNPCDAGELAVRIIQTHEKTRQAYGADYMADASDTETVAGVPGSATPLDGRPNANALAAAVAAGVIESNRGYNLKTVK